MNTSKHLLIFEFEYNEVTDAFPQLFLHFQLPFAV